MPSMLKLLSCAHGHFWETQEDSPALDCPVCGGPPESLPLLASPAEEGPRIEPAASTAEAPDPAPSRRPVVPGYEIEADRGRSPAGVAVYVAKQSLVPRTVLLKVVLAAQDRGQRAWGALRGEAAALGKLSHPNIVQLYEAGERNREFFYNAVEFVDGPTLAQKWSAKPLPFRQSAALVEVLARAVQHAHSRGVVHRSLRPATVQLQMYKSEGDADPVAPPFCLVHSMRCIPKLSDFGLARRPVEGEINDLDLQQGLPSYLAPEQVWGRAKDIGPGTDVYALGAILYELVSGEPPFLGQTVSDTLDLIQARPAKPPGAHRIGVPADLSAICRKCLEKHPRHRYRDARALADDLRRFLGGWPVKARPVGIFGRASRLMRRYPAAAALLICTIVLAGLVTKTTLELSRNRSTLPGVRFYTPQPPFDRSAPEVGAIVGRPGSASSDDDSYFRNIQLAQRAARAGDDHRANGYLQRCPLFLRQWEWFALWQQVQHRTLWHWPRPDVPVSGLAYSPNGRLLAAFGHPNPDLPSVITIWNEAGEEKFRRSLTGIRLSALNWCSDSATLVGLDTSAKLFVFSLRNGVEQDATQIGAVERLSRTGNNSSLRAATLGVFGADPREWLRCEYDGQQLRCCDSNQSWEVLSFGPGIQALACCPQCNLLAVGNQNGLVQIFLTRPPRRLPMLEGHLAPLTALAFSHDGKRLVSASQDGVLCVWNPSDWREILQFTGTTGPPVALAFHPDGKRLAVARESEITLLGAAPP